MTQKELVKAIAAILPGQAMHKTETGARTALEAVGKCLADSLKDGESVRLPHVSSFKVVDSPARKARNPRTGESMDVPATRKVVFKPAPALKRVVTGEEGA